MKVKRGAIAQKCVLPRITQIQNTIYRDCNTLRAGADMDKTFMCFCLRLFLRRLMTNNMNLSDFYSKSSKYALGSLDLCVFRVFANGRATCSATRSVFLGPRDGCQPGIPDHRSGSAGVKICEQKGLCLNIKEGVSSSVMIRTDTRTLCQRCHNAGPASLTLSRHCDSIGRVSRSVGHHRDADGR